MPVLLVRHGEAVGSQGDDLARFLTYKGRSDARKVAVALAQRGIVPAQILSSPLVRAVQTAEIFAGALGFDGTVTTDTAFVPEGDAAHAVRRIPFSTGITIVVCHEPIVRTMAALLAEQPGFPAFRTAGVAMIEGKRVTLTLHPDTA